MRKAVLEQPFEKAGSSEGVRRSWETRRQKGKYNQRAKEVRDVANASLTWGDDAHDYYKKLRDSGKSHEEAFSQMNTAGEKRARSRIGREPLRPLAEFEHSSQKTYLQKSEERKESWQVGGQHPHTARRRKSLPQTVKDAMKWSKDKDAGVIPKTKKRKTLGDVVLGAAKGLHPAPDPAPFPIQVRKYSIGKTKTEKDFDKIREWQEEKK